MTRIGLLSDTHNFVDDALLHVLESCDEIWHAGDIGDISVTDKLSSLKPLRAVYGNIDNYLLRAEFPQNQCFTSDGVPVVMTHIGGYPGKYEPAARKLILQHRPNLFIAGHSHILKVIWDEKYQLLHINPGAAGVHGFHLVRTVVRFTLDNGVIKDLEVVELGKRGAV
jgi:Predicted phosphoesterase